MLATCCLMGVEFCPLCALLGAACLSTAKVCAVKGIAVFYVYLF